MGLYFVLLFSFSFSRDSFSLHFEMYWSAIDYKFTHTHTSACLPAPLALHSLQNHTTFPSHRDPGFLTLSVHTASHKFHTEGCHLLPLPSRKFPLTAISLHCLSPLWVPQGTPLWALCIRILSTPLLSQARLSTVTHTHTPRFPIFSHTSCG